MFNNLYVRSLARVTRLVQYVSPDLACRLANPLWRIPKRRNHTWHKSVRKVDVKTRHGKVCVYKHGRGPAVWLIHGWSGAGSDFWPIMQRYAELGLSTIAFDLPGHGHAGKAAVSLPDLIGAFDEVSRKLKMPDHVVCHDASACVVANSTWFKKYDKQLSLVAPATSYSDMLAAIASSYRLSRPVLHRSLRKLGVEHNQFNKNWNVAEKLGIFGGELTIYHDKHDRVIPYAKSKKLAETEFIPLVTSRHLGHRRILSSRSLFESLIEREAQLQLNMAQSA